MHWHYWQNSMQRVVEHCGATGSDMHLPPFVPDEPGRLSIFLKHIAASREQVRDTMRGFSPSLLTVIRSCETKLDNAATGHAMNPDIMILVEKHREQLAQIRNLMDICTTIDVPLDYYEKICVSLRWAVIRLFQLILELNSTAYSDTDRI